MSELFDLVALVIKKLLLVKSVTFKAERKEKKS